MKRREEIDAHMRRATWANIPTESEHRRSRGRQT
jgi:hypothetical protein